MLSVAVRAMRLELVPNDLRQAGPAALAAWIRTTWLPYEKRFPVQRQREFVSAVVLRTIDAHPPDFDGNVRVAIVRLEAKLLRRV